MMKQKEVAKQFRVSESLISQLIKKQRFTRNHLLAVAIAQNEGTKPIQYINPKLRDIYLAAYPDMNKKVR